MMVKPICSEPRKRRFERVHAVFDKARDVLDHDDGVVDDKAGGDRQRHQRQIVEAESRGDTSLRTCRPATAAPTGSG